MPGKPNTLADFYVKKLTQTIASMQNFVNTSSQPQ